MAFTALPVLLAEATLKRVERLGPGAKLSRDEVGAILSSLQCALEGRSVAALLERASS